MSQRLRHSQAGLTFIELAITMAIAAMSYVVILRWIAYSQRNLLSVEDRNDIILMGRRAAFNISNSVSASAKMFALSYDTTTNNIAVGYQTLAQNSLSGLQAPAEVSWGKLPTLAFNPVTPPVCECTATDPNLHTSAYGDSLLFGATAPPVPMNISISSVSQMVRVDTLQFVFIYLAQVSDKKVTGLPGRLALVEWRSIPYPNFQTMNEFTGDKLANSAIGLYNLGYRFAWDPSAPAATAFYAITNATPYLALAAAPTALNGYSWGEVPSYIEFQRYKPAVTPVGQSFPWGKPGGVSGWKTAYSVAYNTNTTTTDLTQRVNYLKGDGGPINLPQCATATTAGFPGGFEIMVTGKPGGRELCGRLTLMASSAVLSREGPLRFLATETVIFGTFQDVY